MINYGHSEGRFQKLSSIFFIVMAFDRNHILENLIDFTSVKLKLQRNSFNFLVNTYLIPFTATT